MNSSKSSCLTVIFLLACVDLSQGQTAPRAKPFIFHSYVKGPTDSECHHGLMADIDRLILTVDVDMTQLPSRMYGVYIPYYYLMYENSCTGQSNVVCRFNLNNPKRNCHPLVAGYECFCGDFKDNTLRLTANLSAVVHFDRADFFFSYGPMYNPELSHRFPLPEHVLEKLCKEHSMEKCPSQTVNYE